MGFISIVLRLRKEKLSDFFNKTVKMLFFKDLMSLVPHKQGGPVKQLPDSWRTPLVWPYAIIFATTCFISGASLRGIPGSLLFRRKNIVPIFRQQLKQSGQTSFAAFRARFDINARKSLHHSFQGFDIRSGKFLTIILYQLPNEFDVVFFVSGRQKTKMPDFLKPSG
jgi:hypothetical protein